MTRLPLFNSPLLLGFDQFERAVDRISKASADGYPPYNVEQIGENHLRITVAVAGFSAEDLQVQLEDRQLLIRGKRQEEEPGRVFLHQGIAARQFQRTFVLADGIEIVGASLDNGLLSVDLEQPIQASKVRTIDIVSSAKKQSGTAVDAGGARGKAKAVAAEGEG